jgi:hypothetical protein
MILNQFQMRGTPHVHCLVCIKHDGLSPQSAECDDPTEQHGLKELIKKTISAKLIERHELDNNDLPEDTNERAQRRKEEQAYDWTPHIQYFSDRNDPRRVPFDPTLNYKRTAAEHYENLAVQILSRRLQIANQIHRCCPTCFKYRRDRNLICRFCFPWEKDVNSSATDVTILKDRDKKQRVRLRIIPERNNANLNSTFVSPLINCAHGGNSDIQFIMNTHGAAEYAAGYASKAEAPDYNKLQNIFVKAIATLYERNPMVTDCQRLTAAAQSVIGSTQVGAVQAMYFILGQKLVNSSRTVININPIKSKSITTLQSLNKHDVTSH